MPIPDDSKPEKKEKELAAGAGVAPVDPSAEEESPEDGVPSGEGQGVPAGQGPGIPSGGGGVGS
jgi:hypothetical protein